MSTFLFSLNAVVFLILGLIHFYWAFGGDKWLKYAIPTDPSKDNQPNFRPGAFATLVVGVGLCVFSVLFAAYEFNIRLPFIHDYLKYGLTAIAMIFVIRGIGDFKFAGLFKKVKGTLFSEKDTKLFTPLCLWLGFTSLLGLYIL